MSEEQVNEKDTVKVKAKEGDVIVVKKGAQVWKKRKGCRSAGKLGDR